MNSRAISVSTARLGAGAWAATGPAASQASAASPAILPIGANAGPSRSCRMGNAQALIDTNAQVAANGAGIIQALVRACRLQGCEPLRARLATGGANNRSPPMKRAI